MEAILHSFAYSLDFLRDQVEPIPADQLTAQPAGIRNHPAWILGHLAYACQLLGATRGMPVWLPDHWTVRYGTGSVPTAEPRTYESKAKLLAILRDCRSRLEVVVAGLSADQLDAPFPEPSYRDVFPTIRHALTQVLLGHTAYHLGELTVWRRAMGFAPLTRSYE